MEDNVYFVSINVKPVQTISIAQLVFWNRTLPVMEGVNIFVKLVITLINHKILVKNVPRHALLAKMTQHAIIVR